MDHTEKHGIAQRLSSQDMLDILSMYINIGGDVWLRAALTQQNTKTLSNGTQVMLKEIGELHKWHRTLQQGLMRGLIVPAIKSLASCQNPDDRNNATVSLCQELLPIVNKYHLPFI